MLKLNTFVATVGFCLLTVGSGHASDLKFDGQSSVSRSIGDNVQITLAGSPNRTTMVAVGGSPGPTTIFGESLAIGLSPTPSLYAFPDTDATGLASVNYPLPTDPAFIGVTLYAVGLILDPADPNGLDFSMGANLTFTSPAVHIPGAMAVIIGGSFSMGDHHALGGADELPRHLVILDSFLMDVYETTNDSYVAFLNSAFAQGQIAVSAGGYVSKLGSGEVYFYGGQQNGSQSNSQSQINWSGTAFSAAPGKGGHPVNLVSWFGAVAFANWCSTQDGLTPCYDLSTWACSFTANGYRLPTEAEWEYAARGGEHAPYYAYPWGNSWSGSEANGLGSGDPYESESAPSTPVGYYDGSQVPSGVDMANGYGLYDMTGNVWEWCNDWYLNTYYSLGPIVEPTGPTSGSRRSFRGGSHSSASLELPVASRESYSPSTGLVDLGFRLVRLAPIE